ncbi:cold-shock protein [Bacillus aquiflavi]|uniref:Cold-shock protein n=1 Tax=Bacillus aquiflavi TaxID=2672567 RepID=A0A6B3VXZ9_9BACI|nr:cold-shock protein [Bacillus aquiflavi]MBA4538790.1 cold-shock protein [Bacillus aquiflavi]NEY83140.1 cold-shock protein [Bacillus aquiflavi]UAC49966.1 cold-shock protein [Bacillus aquiflavi]
MGNYRGPKEPIPEVETAVWSCTNEECKGWMREAYTFEENPLCPLCKSAMEKEIRILPVIK